MPTLYILCGLPFAGKTTLAHQLVEKLGWSLVSIDEVNKQRNIGNGRVIGPSDWDITYAITFDLTAKYLNEGRNVVYDSVNFTYPQRRKLVELAKKAGASSKVVYVATPKEMAISRWQENRRKGIRGDVRDDDFFRVVENFEEPRQEEQAIIYKNGEKIEMLIDAQ